MSIWLGAIYFFLLLFLSVKNWRAALQILILFLPSYFIRLNFGPLPTTMLEISFGALFCGWILKYSKNDWGEIIKWLRKRRWLSVWLGLFFVASVISVLVVENKISALGIWRAYFLEPMILFFVLIGRRAEIKKDDMIWFLCLSTLSISVLAIWQKCTGTLYPPGLEQGLNGRVTSFFTSPNSIGLYVAPIVPLMIYGIFKTDKKNGYVALLGLALAAILFSFSLGTWVALFIGLAVMFFALGYRKIMAGVMALAVLSAVILPMFSDKLQMKNRSGNNRLVLWSYTVNYLVASPNHFVFGAGLRQWFEKVQKPVNDFTKIEPLIYPHNIFLNFWSEIGLLGMASFTVLYIFAIKKIFSYKKENLFFFATALAVFLVVAIHGMVDVPYFKNDLAMLWWVLVSIILI